MGSNEFESEKDPRTIARQPGCSIANLKLDKLDWRYKVITTQPFELVVLNPSFWHYRTKGYWRFKRCVRCGWGEKTIQINYWECQELSKEESRDFLLNFIIEEDNVSEVD